jgi:hypothetical protein
MLHNQYELFLCELGSSCSCVHVNVTWWQVWILLGWVIVYVNVTSQIWIIFVWVGQLFMWMLHDDKYEFFVGWIIVYVNVTSQISILSELGKQIWVLCELGDNCLCDCYTTSMNSLWVS